MARLTPSPSLNDMHTGPTSDPFTESTLLITLNWPFVHDLNPIPIPIPRCKHIKCKRQRTDRRSKLPNPAQPSQGLLIDTRTRHSDELCKSQDKRQKSTKKEEWRRGKGSKEGGRTSKQAGPMMVRRWQRGKSRVPSKYYSSSTLNAQERKRRQRRRRG